MFFNLFWKLDSSSCQKWRCLVWTIAIHHVLVTITIYRPWINRFWIYVCICMSLCFTLHTMRHWHQVVVPPFTSNPPKVLDELQQRIQAFREARPMVANDLEPQLQTKNSAENGPPPEKIETSTNHQRWQGFKMWVDSGGFPFLLGFV